MCSILEHKKTQREWEWGVEGSNQRTKVHGPCDRGRNSPMTVLGGQQQEGSQELSKI